MTTLTPIRNRDVQPVPRVTDATVFCLATGPSLTQTDVDRVRGRGVVIAVNDAHRLAPWADVLYSSDRYWWMHYRGVPSFAGMKVGIEHTPGRACRELQTLVPSRYVLRNTGHEGVETDPTGLRTCHANSGGAAVNLAVHLGARQIVLLGYNMNDLRGRHFFGDHPSPLSNTHNFPSWRVAFSLMAAPLRALGIDVVNCTAHTSIEAFRCASLDEVLA